MRKSMPSSLAKLGKIEPKYVELDGWTEDITKAKTFEDLPKNAQNYIKFIED
jgi:adenylosuccinate synthase